MTVFHCMGFILRPYKKGDEHSLQRNINDKLIYRCALRIPYPYRMKDAKKWIRSNTIKKVNKKKKYEINFAIDIKGEVVGSIGFKDIEGHKAEIGYWLARKHWNKGITTQAVRRITQFGFSKLKLRRIGAYVFSANRASVRVLEKAGYTYEGKLHKLHKKDGRLVDALLYAKVR